MKRNVPFCLTLFSEVQIQRTKKSLSSYLSCSQIFPFVILLAIFLYFLIFLPPIVWNQHFFTLLNGSSINDLSSPTFLIYQKKSVFKWIYLNRATECFLLNKCHFIFLSKKQFDGTKASNWTHSRKLSKNDILTLTR